MTIYTYISSLFSSLKSAILNFTATRGTFVIPVDPVLRSNGIPVMFGYGADLLGQRNKKGVIILKAARTGVFEQLRKCDIVAYTQGGLTSGVGKFYKLYRQYTVAAGKKFNPTVPALYLILRYEDTGILEVFRYNQM
jgi:hypothetical protein